LRAETSVCQATLAAAEIHPEIGVDFTVLTMQIRNSLMRDRLMATLAGAFGLLAGVLSVLGLYGVIAYMVARRRNEIGSVANSKCAGGPPCMLRAITLRCRKWCG
jgi:putative ABC transport system permease protein